MGLGFWIRVDFNSVEQYRQRKYATLNEKHLSFTHQQTPWLCTAMHSPRPIKALWKTVGKNDKEREREKDSYILSHFNCNFQNQILFFYLTKISKI